MSCRLLCQKIFGGMPYEKEDLRSKKRKKNRYL